MEAKPKILIVVGNRAWCWRTTMENLAYYLHGFDIDIISAYEFKKMKSYEDYVFVYFRGYANAFIDANNESRMLPFISTLTTGGERLPIRMEEMKDKAMRGWGIVVQNKTAYHKCKEQGYENISIIPSGVNCNVYKPSVAAPALKYVGMAGNMQKDRALLKGKPFVEEACKNLFDNAIYYVETNIDSPLTYEQMSHWYQNLFVYAQPSDSEGCSNSVMEAMACAIPCLIVEGVGYHGEVCLDGLQHESGQVVFVKRNAKDIREKIIALREDPESYNRISKNAREFALNHDWRHISSAYRDMFEQFFPIAEKMNEKRTKVLSEKIFKIKNNGDIAKVIDSIIKSTGLEKSTRMIIDIFEKIGD